MSLSKLLFKACISSLIGAAVLLSTAAGDAGKKSANAGPRGSADASAPVLAMALADELAIYGIRNGDAIAIIQAAKMLQLIPSRDLASLKTSTAASGSRADKPDGNDLSVEALMKRAERMAGANATLLELIRDARTAKSRGAVRGAKIHRDAVPAGGTDRYDIAFRGGEQAAVWVSGDGDTDLDLQISDENGNYICSDTDDTDTMLCRWTPVWTGSFRISIKNNGRVLNRYKLAVN
jgi:hypothetical protein